MLFKYERVLFAESMKETEEESDNLHRQLLDREIDLSSFTHKYKKLRISYHQRALIQLAARTTWNLKNPDSGSQCIFLPSNFTAFTAYAIATNSSFSGLEVEIIWTPDGFSTKFVSFL